MVYNRSGKNVLVVAIVVVLIFNFSLSEFAVEDFLVFVHSVLKCLHVPSEKNVILRHMPSS